MKEQDFIPERAPLRKRLLFVSSELRGAAAAAASAAAAAMCAFVLVVLPPVPGPGILAAAEGLRAATAFA